MNYNGNIEKYAANDCYNIEILEEYLKNRNIVNLNVFQYTNLDCDIFYISKTVNETKKHAFINRLPIYFYDYLSNSDKNYMDDLLKNYEKSKLRNKNSIEDFISYDTFFDVFDVFLDDFKMSIDDVMSYLIKETEGEMNFWIFNTWAKYLRLIKNCKEKDLYPINLLYSYNVELEKNGMNPIIYTVDTKENGEQVKEIKNSFFYTSGYFPTDLNGKLVTKWIGIWGENVNILLDANDSVEINIADLKMRFHEKSNIKRKIKILINSNSLIYFAQEKYFNSNDVFYERYSMGWELVFCGFNRMKINYSYFSKIRREHMLSLKSVSQATGIKLRTLQRIENGECGIDAINFIKLFYLYSNSNNIYEYLNGYYFNDENFINFRSGKSLSAILTNG